jgi:hypothetical protein
MDQRIKNLQDTRDILCRANAYATGPASLKVCHAIWYIDAQLKPLMEEALAEPVRS